jgi:hypothetical protein
MNSEHKSLRQLVEKWLSPADTTPVHVTRLIHTRFDPGKCVRVEVIRREGPISILFFRHYDGTWSVFPRESPGLTMGSYPSVT